MVLLSLIAVFSTALAGACPKDTADKVLEQAQAADTAFEEMDEVRFEVAEGRIDSRGSAYPPVTLDRSLSRHR